MSLAILILAAGKGTRFKSRRPKVLHAIGGKTMLEHVIARASSIVTPANIYVVVGDKAEQIEATVAATGVNFVLQAEQRGIGNAIQCARQAVAGYDEIVVLPGDAPLIRTETIEMLLEHHRLGAAMSILTAFSENPVGYGRVQRKGSEDGMEVKAVVGPHSLNTDQLTIRKIDSGIYAFNVPPLLKHLDQLTSSDATEEYYLSDLAKILASAGEQVFAVETPDALEVMGVKTIADLVELDSALRCRTASRLMENGVTIFRPETCVIDADVEVEADTVIEPNVQLLGKTRIGADCLIRSGTVIENSTIADSVLIRQSCVITDSTVGSEAKIGPFAHLRPGSEIGPEAHIGNFVETKKARLGRGAKASHLTYLGDAEIGAGTNIGAGVITCNYDGVNKHKTIIGENSFVGSDSTLVAPVSIGDGAYVGAGSCITKDVPKDALAVARGRQMNKEGWAAAKRSRNPGNC